MASKAADGMVQGWLRCGVFAAVLVVMAGVTTAQEPVYVNPLPADPPYYRVRYEASSEAGELVYPVSFTVWIPPQVDTLRGVVVHQHGCGEGSCKSGQTGAYDLHWQALARKHACALLSPVYEQPEKANCQLWCDPRNGSDAAFQRALVDLGKQSQHPELATVPWALWGHSGGGHWVGGMALLHPERVAAAWLRSGVPMLTEAEGKPKPYSVPDAALGVPMMCNLGTKEGVTDKENRFAGVWPGVEPFFQALRSKNALIGVAVDPLSSHDCGNQRYLAIPWLDACLTARLPDQPGGSLKPLSADDGWLGEFKVKGSQVNVTNPVSSARFSGERDRSVWLPNEAMAVAWTQYITDTAVTDKTPPPAPKELRLTGNVLTWTAEADLESGLAGFIIERDGAVIAKVPTEAKNPFGRPLFQNLSYSDTPTQPLAVMQFTDPAAEDGKLHRYRVIAVNTAGLQSEPVSLGK